MKDKEMIEIRWHGRGGQGVVTAGKLLAETAMGTGQYIQAFPDFGPERMGAPVRSFTRLSSKPIRIHSQIEHPDVVLVLDPTLLGTVPVTEGLKEDGILIVNTSMSPEEVRKLTGFRTGKVFTVDASHIAIEEMGREITNTPMLGAFARATGLFDLDALEKQVREWFSEKVSPGVVEANIRILRRAAQELREG
ncbi:MAG: 2-oxoacid:acceptor oxidoreductase family protein [Anaerolineae bacterium]|nr:2-oxoacid:acceptor oxidoreductase family protein [Anaerolineae bacterium]MCX8066289.1 2-oxoacid:acceptor oxidoreductase family protein [Anaerolineae bacterium]MDW7991764.1 2-oxoacid:acceptor oxidoreductase family protein [Anaerolineae bacterium]